METPLDSFKLPQRKSSVMYAIVGKQYFWIEAKVNCSCLQSSLYAASLAAYMVNNRQLIECGYIAISGRG